MRTRTSRQRQALENPCLRRAGLEAKARTEPAPGRDMTVVIDLVNQVLKGEVADSGSFPNKNLNMRGLPSYTRQP